MSAQDEIIEEGSGNVFADLGYPNAHVQQAKAVLAAAGMDHRHIVDAHVYITDRAHLALYRATRDRFLKGYRPAATLLIVAGLADERLVVEVDLVAAAEAAGPAT